MALSPQTAHSPSLAAPLDLVSVSGGLTTGADAAGAECGGDGIAKWPAADATSLLDDEMDEPGVVGVAGDWTAAHALATH